MARYTNCGFFFFCPPCKTLHGFLARETDYRKRGGLRFRASSFDPWLFFIFGANGGSVGAIPTHVDDIFRFCEIGVLQLVQRYLGRHFGAPELQEKVCTRVGTEVPQDEDFSVTFPQGTPTEELQPIPTSPKFLGPPAAPCLR